MVHEGDVSSDRDFWSFHSERQVDVSLEFRFLTLLVMVWGRKYEGAKCCSKRI